MKQRISNMETYEQKLKAQKEGMRIFGNDPDAETPMWTKTSQVLRDGLIALDCLELGMTHRETAIVLYGKATVEAQWKKTSMKGSLRYLINKAKALRDGGYLVELLGSQLGPHALAA